MQTLSEIRAMLEKRGIRPKHRLGQNFLHDLNQLKKLVAAADAGPGQLVVEIGPGTGTLTEALLETGAEVIACELDRDMAAIVRELLGDTDQLTLVEGDCLEDERRLNAEVVEAIGGREFKLVANLPYQAASAVMATLVMHHKNCRGQWVTIQREVAERIASAPGSKVYGALTVLIQSRAEVKVLGTVKPASFWPIPNVTSALVQITPARWAMEGVEGFATFVTGVFSKRRKQIGTIVGAEVAERAGVNAKSRPEELSPTEFWAVWRLVSAATGEGVRS